jgi:hypothetical protein
MKTSWLNRNYLVPEEAASMLGCNPHSLRLAARNKPELLGFPVIVIGNRVKIPKGPFLKALYGGDAPT